MTNKEVEIQKGFKLIKERLYTYKTNQTIESVLNNKENLIARAKESVNKTYNTCSYLLRNAGYNKAEYKKILKNVRKGEILKTEDKSIKHALKRYLKVLNDYKALNGLTAIDMSIKHGGAVYREKEIVELPVVKKVIVIKEQPKEIQPDVSYMRCAHELARDYNQPNPNTVRKIQKLYEEQEAGNRGASLRLKEIVNGLGINKNSDLATIQNYYKEEREKRMFQGHILEINTAYGNNKKNNKKENRKERVSWIEGDLRGYIK